MTTQYIRLMDARVHKHPHTRQQRTASSHNPNPDGEEMGRENPAGRVSHLQDTICMQSYAISIHTDDLRFANEVIQQRKARVSFRWCQFCAIQRYSWPQRNAGLPQLQPPSPRHQLCRPLQSGTHGTVTGTPPLCPLRSRRIAAAPAPRSDRAVALRPWRGSTRWKRHWAARPPPPRHWAAPAQTRPPAEPPQTAPAASRDWPASFLPQNRRQKPAPCRRLPRSSERCPDCMQIDPDTARFFAVIIL